MLSKVASSVFELLEKKRTTKHWQQLLWAAWSEQSKLDTSIPRTHRRRTQYRFAESDARAAVMHQSAKKQRISKSSSKKATRAFPVAKTDKPRQAMRRPMSGSVALKNVEGVAVDNRNQSINVTQGILVFLHARSEKPNRNDIDNLTYSDRLTSHTILAKN